MPDRITTRFAPSPTGYLHLGTAFAALTAWRRAREAGGRFLLRIEDIDSARCRPEYTAAIFEDLRWLGLDWDGDARVQSEHLSEYRAALDALSARGLLYPCFCTRAEIAREAARSASAPHTPDGSPVYPGTCRHPPKHIRAGRMAAGDPYVLRLDMRRAIDETGQDLRYVEEGEGEIACRPQRSGDVVLARRDAPASYHLCVTHDDAAQGITLVTRGRDLRPATAIHRLLQALSAWPEPAYAHHRLLLNEDGRRLSKRDGALSLRAMRERGVDAATVRERARSARANV